MNRQTIDFGIDLGTTNSAIAVVNQGRPVIVKNDQQKDTTPSCVYYSRAGQWCVGDEACRRHRRDITRGRPSRAHTQFKTRMGSDHMYRFPGIDTAFSPEQLSAELLKVMRSFVRDDVVDAAVVTVPAAFGQMQVEATQRAAELAGLVQTELLPEPLAASIAFSIDTQAAAGHWLVFDFGGGTFDAVLMRTDEGLMRVVDIAGDNRLGGKDIDELLVDEIFTPAISDAFAIDRIMADPLQAARMRRLLTCLYAEDAKIALSSQEAITVELEEELLEDDDGHPIVDLNVPITRDRVAALAAPIIDRALRICHDVLKRNGLGPDDLRTVLLVGGPTYMPCIRERLAAELCARIDFSIDPMTAVARGAALYAATMQRTGTARSHAAGARHVSLAYPRTTVEETVSVGIRVDGHDETAGPLVVEVTRGDGRWKSDRISLVDGAALVSVPLVKSTANVFAVALYSARGDRVPCEPDSCTIMQGVKIGSPPLPFDICVQVSTPRGDRLKAVVRKGQTLPATGTIRGLTTKAVLRPGSERDVVAIPLYEGSRDTRPLHNRYLGELRITGGMVSAMVPSGSDAEITVRIDSSRRKSVSVYFDATDETFEEVMAPLQKQPFDMRAVPLGLEEARLRIEQLAERLPREGNGEVAGFRKSLEAAQDLNGRGHDRRESAEAALERLGELHRDLDIYEHAMRDSIECGFLTSQLSLIEPKVMAAGNPMEQAELAIIREQADAAVAALDGSKARQLCRKAGNLFLRVVDRQPDYWMGFLYTYRSDIDRIKWRD
ncbi:MAG: Hsp70 family protein, partial [Chitinivibrionales bacterium]|nr:Hsp70 family protein [Chitinivibrionales bacterium]